MWHDPALGRIVGTRLADRWPRLARFGLAINRPVLIAGLALAIALLALMPGRALYVALVR